MVQSGFPLHNMINILFSFKRFHLSFKVKQNKIKQKFKKKKKLKKTTKTPPQKKFFFAFTQFAQIL